MCAIIWRDFVAITPRRDIQPWRSSRGGLWWQRLYVDPTNGLLCRTDQLPEEKARQRAKRNRPAPPIDCIALAMDCELRLIDGHWFEVRRLPCRSPFIEVVGNSWNYVGAVNLKPARLKPRSTLRRLISPPVWDVAEKRMIAVGPVVDDLRTGAAIGAAGRIAAICFQAPAFNPRTATTWRTQHARRCGRPCLTPATCAQIGRQVLNSRRFETWIIEEDAKMGTSEDGLTSGQDESNDWRTAEEREEDIAQAKAATRTGARGRFGASEIYLPPGPAEWVLDFVARGVFANPSRSRLRHARRVQGFEPHADLSTRNIEALDRSGNHDPRPRIPAEEVFERLRKKMEEPSPEPAVWRKNLYSQK